MTDKSIVKEVEPLISDTPSITIKKKEYKLRRLGVADTFKLARIMSIGAGGLGKNLSTLGEEVGPGNFPAIVFASFPYAGKDVTEFLASVINVKEEDFSNPDNFPMGTEMDIVYALAKHVDVIAFFGKLTGIMMKPLSKERLKKA